MCIIYIYIYIYIYNRIVSILSEATNPECTWKQVETFPLLRCPTNCDVVR